MYSRFVWTASSIISALSRTATVSSFAVTFGSESGLGDVSRAFLNATLAVAKWFEIMPFLVLDKATLRGVLDLVGPCTVSMALEADRSLFNASIVSGSDVRPISLVASFAAGDSYTPGLIFFLSKCLVRDTAGDMTGLGISGI